MSAVSGEDLRAMGIVIEPQDALPGHPPSIQGASYDFRIGDQVWLWSEPGVRSLREGDTLTLRRNDIAIIKTYETIRMPNNACGILVNKVAPHAMGVFLPSASIDPGFEGHLFVAWINQGRFDVPIKWRNDLCTGMFWLTSSPARISHKRVQDFSQLVGVFADFFEIMYPPRLEPVRADVTLQQVAESVLWRGEPFVSLYSLAARQDARLAALESAVRRGVFSHWLMLAGPWIIVLAVIALIIASGSLGATEIGIIGSIASVIALAITVGQMALYRRIR